MHCNVDVAAFSGKRTFGGECFRDEEEDLIANEVLDAPSRYHT
jgi:hypothetical protein